MSDDPTSEIPTPSEPPAGPGASASRSNRLWKAAAITAGVLVVALVIALIVRGNGGDSTNKVATTGGSVTSGSGGSSTTATAVATGGQGVSGVVQVNGGGKTGVTKPPPPTDTTPTTSEPTTTTTVTSTTGTFGGVHPPIVSLPTFISQQPIQPLRLNYQGIPKFGDMNMGDGFSPDPATVAFTDGGAVNVNYLGGSCSGYASVAPTIRVNYSGGGSLLRFYIVGNSTDAAMVVNDPYGNFYCVNDSFGTVNPTIDFNNPAGGTYDIWAAAPSSSPISGTFFATGNSGNHP